MNNLSDHHGAGTPEGRGPMQLHWLKACPGCMMSYTGILDYLRACRRMSDLLRHSLCSAFITLFTKCTILHCFSLGCLSKMKIARRVHRSFSLQEHLRPSDIVVSPDIIG